MYNLYTLFSKYIMYVCVSVSYYWDILLSRLNCQKQTCLLVSNKMQCQEECLKYDTRGNSKWSVLVANFVRRGTHC